MNNQRVERIVEVVAVGALVALAALLALGAVPSVGQWKAAAFFTGFGVLASILAYRTSQATHGSIGFLPFLSVALVSPNSAAVISVVVSSLIGETLARRSRIKVIFNASQHGFAVSVGIAGYLAVGGQSLLDGPPRTIPFLLLAASYFTLNKLAVSTVVAASTGLDTRRHWTKSMRDSVVYDILAFPIIIFFAMVYARFGPGWSAVLALPMLGIRQLYHNNFALQKINEELLQLMVASIEARDPYTSGHSQRVSRYARVIAKAAGLGGRGIERTVIAALLHDVGKIHEEFAVILRKPGALTDEEFAVMKTHPGRSAELVKKVSQFSDLVPSVLAHHEAWDGRGYPDKLSGSDIPTGARVIALADTIDAMTTSRPYRSAMSTDQVRAEIERESGRQFDPKIVRVLLEPSMWAEMTREIVAANADYPTNFVWDESVVVGRTGEYSFRSNG